MNNTLGKAMRSVLAQAKVERRLVCGLLPSINCLGQHAEDALLCVVTESRPGDSTTHMQMVLLQAYCCENSIPVIQVDSSERLAKFCGGSANLQCVIIRKNVSKTGNSRLGTTNSAAERTLTEFYQNTLEDFPRPIVQLPR